MNRKPVHYRAGLRRRVRAGTGEDSHACSGRSTRRKLIIAAASWPALAWAGAVLAQSKQPILIGWLSAGSRESGERNRNVFKTGLAALGWKVGSQVAFEERFADGHTDRLPALAEELAAKRPALIVASQTRAAMAAATAAPKIPVVILGGNPVSAGLVKSYARPGGMVTGISSVSTEISEKYLELLLAAAPKSRRVGFLIDLSAPNIAIHKENVRRSVAQHKVEARFAEVARSEEINPALSRLAKEGVQALVIPTTVSLRLEWERILRFALSQRWPVIGYSGWAEKGALLSYGADGSAMTRRAAYYVDRILKGVKPADLPIERPTKFELVVNLKTAKAIGLTISQDLLFRADKVIE